MHNDNYPVESAAKSLAGAVMRKADLTLRENIDGQIAQAQKHVEALTATKERMEKSGILDMRIDDIQAAMRW